MKNTQLVRFCSRYVAKRYFGSGSGGIRGGDSPPCVSKPQTASTFATAPKANLVETDDLPLICTVPLSKSPPNFPTPSYAASPNFENVHTQVTTLNNGLKVASEPKFGEFCTIGVMIDVGSRYESAFPGGLSHFLEKLAFNSTKSFTSREEITNLLEKYGGMVDCQATKDTLVYAASCHISGIDQVMKLIADATMRPLFRNEELTFAKNVVASDVETLNMKPEPDEILQDWIHAAAYRDNTLGLPKICPAENVDKISRNILLKFMKTYFLPNRMVVAGVGVPHEHLVEICDKYFQKTPTIWQDEQIETSNDFFDESVAQYTGGIIKKEKDLSNVGLAINPFPTLAHFVLGLESCSYKDPDFVPFCVLNSLLGGGGSFSAGGPGKGMYTRLYLNVLNQYYWMYNAISFNLAYADSGIFYIHASAEPGKLSNVVSVIVNEFIQTAGKLQTGEFERAKIQLQSMLMMNLEQRPVVFEDICRQVLGHGYRKPPAEVLEDIKKVTSADLVRVAERMLTSKAAVVGYGNLAGLPDYEKIDAAISKRDVECLKTPFFSWR